MKRKLPPVLILANRGKLVAYRHTEEGPLEPLEVLEPMEGNRSLSEIVTDQAGAFPTGGGPGTASYESLPLLEEMDLRSERKIAARIETILSREEAPAWGFAAASEVNGAILDHLRKEWREAVRFNLKRDLTNIPRDEVLARFEEAAEIPFSFR